MPFGQPFIKQKMKKIILLSAFMLSSVIASAQFITWEDDFNDGEASEWTFLDVDGNTSKWSARKNLLTDPNTGEYIYGTSDVLFTSNLDFTTGTFFPNSENNWAITPVQDLSFYSGTIQLIINGQLSEFGGTSENVLVYASTSATMDSFLLNVPVTVALTRSVDQGEQFMEHIVDLSQYAGQQEVYIAIVKSGNFVGVEINDIKITASDIAGVTAITKTATIIKQNPVTENLQLQLGSNVNADALNIAIYNVTGTLVKEAKYNEAGIQVSDLAGGMYFAVLNDGNATEQLKFIKK